MTCYSDYPIPKEFPIFMHNKDILKYFNMYADNFNLKKYIRFRTQVYTNVAMWSFPEFKVDKFLSLFNFGYGFQIWTHPVI